MTREQRLMRLFRALSGDNQEELSRELGVHRTLLTQIEAGGVATDPRYLEKAADRAEISMADGDQLLRLYDTMCRARLRWGLSPDDLLDDLAAELRSELDAAYRRLLTVALPESTPRPEDREPAEELFRRLQAESAAVRPSIVRAAEEFQTWALCERVCAAAMEAASRDLGEAGIWARLARQIADRVPGPEGFRCRLQGYAAACEAWVLRASGDLGAAEAALEGAERLWRAGEDPYSVLETRLPAQG